MSALGIRLSWSFQDWIDFKWNKEKTNKQLPNKWAINNNAEFSTISMAFATIQFGTWYVIEEWKKTK